MSMTKAERKARNDRRYRTPATPDNGWDDGNPRFPSPKAESFVVFFCMALGFGFFFGLIPFVIFLFLAIYSGVKAGK